MSVTETGGCGEVAGEILGAWGGCLGWTAIEMGIGIAGTTPAGLAG